MVLVIPVNAGQFAEGWEQGRRSKWDDAERGERLKQDFVRTNIAQSTQDSNIFSTNAQNRYRGNNAIRTDEYEGIMQPGKIDLGLAGQRNDLNTLNQNFHLSRAAHPGNMATTRDASDLAVSTRNARKDTNYFTTRANTENSEAINDLTRRETLAVTQRPYIERDVAGGEMLRRQQVEQQYDMGATQRAVQLGADNVRRILASDPESATQALQQAGVLPQGTNVVPMRDEAGNEVLGVPNAVGQIVPLHQVMSDMYQRHAQMVAAQQAAQAEKEAPRNRAGSTSDNAEASSPAADPLGAIAPEQAAAPQDLGYEQLLPSAPPVQVPQEQAAAPLSPSPAQGQDITTSSIPAPRTHEEVPQYVAAVRQEAEAKRQDIMRDPSLSEGYKQRAIALINQEEAAVLEPMREREEELRRESLNAVLDSSPGLSREQLPKVPPAAMAATLEDIRAEIANIYGSAPDDRQVLQILSNIGRGDLAARVIRYLDSDIPNFMDVPLYNRNSVPYPSGSDRGAVQRYLDIGAPEYFGVSSLGE